MEERNPKVSGKRPAEEDQDQMSSIMERKKKRQKKSKVSSSSSSGTLFDLLPEEILVHVLSFLNFANPSNFALLTCFDVADRFRRCASFSITRLRLWHSWEMSTSRAKDLLDLCPRLTELDLVRRGTSDSWQLAAWAMKKCPDLRNLGKVEIDGAEYIECASVEVMYNLCNYGKKIQTICLKGADFWHDDYVRNPEEVPLWKSQIKSLTLVSCGGMNDKLLKLIADCCPMLETFCVVGGRKEWSDNALCSFVGSVKDTLQYLRLPFSNGSDFFLEIGQCRRLHTLSLECAKDLNRERLMSIASLPLLRSLHLCSTSNLVKAKDYIDAFGKKKLDGMKELILICNKNLSDAALAVIASNCQSLTGLFLWGCDGLTDVGIRAVVRNCLKLKSFSIGCNSNITRAAFEDIATLMPDLKSVRIYKCKNIDETFVKEVAAANSRITWQKKD